MNLARAEYALALALRRRANTWATADPAKIAAADAAVVRASQLVDKLRPSPQPIEVNGWRDFYQESDKCRY
jgi:hypothetical protein